MSRLTARNENGEAYYPECFEKCDGDGSSEKCNDCEFNHRVCESLAEHEEKKEKSVYQIIEEVKNDICDNYCKHPVGCENFTQEEWDKFAEEICSKCPLNRL